MTSTDYFFTFTADISIKHASTRQAQYSSKIVRSQSVSLAGPWAVASNGTKPSPWIIAFMSNFKKFAIYLYSNTNLASPGYGRCPSKKRKITVLNFN